jgi:hypothetical protein
MITCSRAGVRFAANDNHRAAPRKIGDALDIDVAARRTLLEKSRREVDTRAIRHEVPVVGPYQKVRAARSAVTAITAS